MGDRTCSIDGCERPFYGQHRCKFHHQQWYRSAAYDPEPHGRGQIQPVEDRFWRFVDKTAPNGCWLWTGTKARGYGTFRIMGVSYRAARLSYEWARGPIPAGLTVDHLCRVIACVNPSHLEAVSIQENIRRANAVRFDCRNGHPYTEASTYRYRGHRMCRICHATNERQRKARLRAERRAA